MLSKFLLLVLVLTFSSVKYEGFTCKSITVTKCKSLAGYVPPNSTTLASIANLFGTDIDSLVGANSLTITSPSEPVAANQTIKIPFPCSCKKGYGVSDNSPIYKVKPGDGLDHIARNIYSSLVTYQEIADANYIADPDDIKIGQSLRIPFPCSCDAVDGNQVLHYAHKVSPKETLEIIGKEFGVTENTLLALNDLDDAKDLKAESILDVPLKVCTSMVIETSPDYPLLVSDATYAFTAHNCAKCYCNSSSLFNWMLYCRSDVDGVQIKQEYCRPAQCVGKNYSLGSYLYCDLESTTIEDTCVYTGYNNQSKTISVTMVNITDNCHEQDTSSRSPSGSPSMNLQGWSILWLSMTMSLLLSSFGLF